MVAYVTKKRETKHERGGLCLSEEEARYFFLQIISAVEYCHAHQVAHRYAMSCCRLHLSWHCKPVFQRTPCARFCPCNTTCLRAVLCRRDLKLDNTLLDTRAFNPPWIKLCDFGFAKHWQANSNMDTMRIGTPEYMGPELITSR